MKTDRMKTDRRAALRPALLCALFLLTLAAACKRGERIEIYPPPPTTVDTLVGSWNIDTLVVSFSGLPIAIVPTSSDLTLDEGGKGTMQYKGAFMGFPLDENADIVAWSTRGNQITLLTDNGTTADTVTYTRQINELNQQRWVDAPGQAVLRLTRK